VANTHSFMAAKTDASPQAISHVTNRVGPPSINVRDLRDEKVVDAVAGGED
jgi:hypothetical protein